MVSGSEALVGVYSKQGSGLCWLQIECSSFDDNNQWEILYNMTVILLLVNLISPENKDLQGDLLGGCLNVKR